MKNESLQKICVDIINHVDKKCKIKRNVDLSYFQLLEEIGELARELNSPRLRNKKIDQKNLQGEFADIAIQLFGLAQLLKVDISQAVRKKIKIVKQRHNL